MGPTAGQQNQKPLPNPQTIAREQQTEQLLNQLQKTLPKGINYDKIKDFILHGCKCENPASNIIRHYLMPTCEESIVQHYIAPSCQEEVMYKYLKPACEEQETIYNYLKPSCETCESITDMVKTLVRKGCNVNTVEQIIKTEKQTKTMPMSINGFSNIELNDDDHAYSINNYNNNPTLYHSKESINEGFNNFDNEYSSYTSDNKKDINLKNFLNDNFFFNPKLSSQQISKKNNEDTNIIENFQIDEPKSNSSAVQILGLPAIKSNKLYYGLPCEYIKDDCFYNALKQEGFKMTDDAKEASLVVPCSYENTENEIEELQKVLVGNIYGTAIRVFMLNNTDYMVSKIALWKFLRDRYGRKIASTMIPESVDLTDKDELDAFKKNFDKNKLYITKNNNQRQEGLEIHNKLETILSSTNKYILVQELLQDPYLINGRKINLRVYCLLVRDTNNNTLVQVYQDGFMYYTPEYFEKGNPSFKKNITTGYIDRKVYDENPLTHEDFKRYLDNPNRKLSPVEEYFIKTRPNMKLSTYVFTQINHLLKFILETYITTLGTKTLGVGFQLYGADIAINEHLKPMIMEINKGPDLTAKDGRDRTLKENMCRDILKSVGLVQPNVNNKFLTIMEVVNMNNQLVEFDNYSE